MRNTALFLENTPDSFRGCVLVAGGVNREQLGCSVCHCISTNHLHKPASWIKEPRCVEQAHGSTWRGGKCPGSVPAPVIVAAHSPWVTRLLELHSAWLHRHTWHHLQNHGAHLAEDVRKCSPAINRELQFEVARHAGDVGLCTGSTHARLENYSPALTRRINY